MNPFSSRSEVIGACFLASLLFSFRRAALRFAISGLFDPFPVVTKLFVYLKINIKVIYLLFLIVSIADIIYICVE